MLKLHIQNFKSIEDLELDLGRVNLFIGENGCGKTSILEAVGMAAAAFSGDLGAGGLKDRGIRVADPPWMRSGFSGDRTAGPLLISFKQADVLIPLILNHDNTPYGAWRQDWSRVLPPDTPEFERFPNMLREAAVLRTLGAIAPTVNHPGQHSAIASFFLYYADQLHLPNFLTYAPREDVLRDLARDSDVEPIGVHGEGLFKLLQVLDAEGQLAQVKEHLAALGWFDDLSVASGVNPSSRVLQIRDIYLDGERPFDQRSANEGFLFVLLYACLLISRHTPRFFAVDNVDTALNPKLCARTVRMFAELSKSHDRRVLLTAHNPGALDGLDLHDDEQRLFVVYRNTEGRTRARRILPVDLPTEGPPLRLSEAFLRGYLGALPTNF